MNLRDVISVMKIQGRREHLSPERWQEGSVEDRLQKAKSGRVSAGKRERGQQAGGAA